MSIFRPSYTHPIRYVYNASLTVDVTFYTRIDDMHFPMGVLISCDLVNDACYMFSDYVFDFVWFNPKAAPYELSVLAPHVIERTILVDGHDSYLSPICE